MKKAKTLSLSLSSKLKHYSPRRTTPGFTIVELLIVIVVIAILAAIVIVSYSGITSRAQASSAQAALAQANKKLALYVVDNNSSYPADQASFSTLTNTTSDVTKPNSIQYSVNNTVNPKTYCITATTGSTSYMSSSTNQTPTAGGCPGHGVGGVAAITNLAVNPSMETNMNNIAPMGPAGSDTTRVLTTTWADSGVQSLLVTKSITDDTPSGIRVGLTQSLVTGDVVSWGATVRNNTSSSRVFQLYGERSSPTYAGISSGSFTVPAGIAQRITGTVTVTSGFAGTPAGFGVLPSSSFLIGESYNIDSFFITVNKSLPTNYADGSSPNWIWNGTANASTSTGPPL